MRLATLAAFALLTAGSVSAATTFAGFIPDPTAGTPQTMQWGCGSSCSPTTVSFNFSGVAGLPAAYSGPLFGATLTYDWAPVGTTTSYFNGFATGYWQYVEGSFAITYDGGTTNLVTVDFPGSQALLEYSPTSPTSGDLFLLLSPGIGTSIAPSMSSDVLYFPGLTDWSFMIDFGNQNPGFAQGGNINGFTSTVFNGTVGATPFPTTVPEPASMMMAGAGLLLVSGLLGLRKRFHK
ncbi:MAG: PEP-CTERM sorting domain-containing protein [Bryobacteraceae bacterium]|nr:PEP-CTERM sorting domain-containing protein [Bryobacteraceae bacterium]